MSLLSRARDLAARDPERVFSHFVQKGTDARVTYGDLWRHSAAYGRLYEELGLAPKSVVIIMHRHSPELYYSFVGAMMAGMIPSFMPFPSAKQDPELFWKSHRELFAHIGVGALVSHEEFAEKIRDILPGEVPLVLTERLGREPGVGAEIDYSPADVNDVAFLQHSSGTTGLKKGVMLSHRAVLEQAASYAPTIRFGEESIVASWLPLYHDMGLIACFILPLVFGATIVHLDPFEWVAKPTTILDAVQTHRATHIWLPNFAFSHLAAARPRRGSWSLGSLEAIMNCSEPCKTFSMTTFTETYADCGLRPNVAQVCYAMAEAVFAATQTRLDAQVNLLTLDADVFEAERRAVVAALGAGRTVDVVSCGEPIPGMTVRIVDDEGESLEEGRIGEICLSASYLYDGYYRQPERTAEKLKNGWHHTGDLGFVFDGEVYVTGRRDDLLIVRGRNFYAHELERIVNEVDGVYSGRNTIFAVADHRAGTNELICLVEPRDGADALELRRTIRARVETVTGAILGRVIVVERGALYKTTSGKISRVQNRTAYLGGTMRELGA